MTTQRLGTVLIGCLLATVTVTTVHSSAAAAPAGPADQATAAAAYLGSTPEQATRFFEIQNADLDALERLRRLTADTDGAFFKNGQATVNVTSPRAARLATGLGLTPRTAARGQRALDALGARIRAVLQKRGLAGSATLEVDVAGQGVVVNVRPDKRVQGDPVWSSVASLAGVRVQPGGAGYAVPTALHYAGRGMRLYSSSSGSFVGDCTQGFGGTLNGDRVMMTVGHCVEGIGTVRDADTGYLGARIAGAFNAGSLSDDVGVIQLSTLADSYTNIDTHVGTHVVQGWRSPVAGMTVCKSGTTTGWTCGDVGTHRAAYEVEYCSVWFLGGCVVSTPVRDLWSMTACTRPGDSGGPIMSGDYAIGLVSGAGGAHGATACPLNSGRQYATSGDLAHASLFVSVAHLRASYPGLELRHS